jgi:hypothetical protein
LLGGRLSLHHAFEVLNRCAYGADSGTANRKMTPQVLEYFRNEKSLEQSTIDGLNTPLAAMVQSAQDSGRIILSGDDVAKKFGTLLGFPF